LGSLIKIRVGKNLINRGGSMENSVRKTALSLNLERRGK